MSHKSTSKITPADQMSAILAAGLAGFCQRAKDSARRAKLARAHRKAGR